MAYNTLLNEILSLQEDIDQYDSNIHLLDSINIEIPETLKPGIAKYMLLQIRQDQNWQTYYEKLFNLYAHLQQNDPTKADGHIDIIKRLIILYNIYHNEKYLGDKNKEVNAREQYFKDDNTVPSEQDARFKRDFDEKIDTYINDTLQQNYNTTEKEFNKYPQIQANIKITDLNQVLTTNKKNIFLDSQKIWLNQHIQIRNLLHAGNNAKLNIIKHAIITGFLKQGTVNHILTQITADNMNYETFYGEHLNKLYTHLLKNSMSDADACKVIVAFKHIFDIYHNEKCKNNDATQTSWQRHFPNLDINNNNADEFKQQITTLIQNEIDNNNEQVKKDQNDYAKNCQNFSQNPRWQYYSPEDENFTKEQLKKLGAQTARLENLLASSLRLLAIAIVNKYNTLAGHPAVNSSYNELTQSDQLKVNYLMSFLSSGIPLLDGKPDLEALNYAIMHAASRGDASIDSKDFRRLHGIDPEHFDINIFRKIRFETDTKNAKAFKKDAEIIEKALLPQKIQQNIEKLITKFIDQTQINSVEEVPQIISMLKEIIKQPAEYTIAADDTNNPSTIHTNILYYMENFKPDDLTIEEFNTVCTYAIQAYINEHLSNENQHQLFFNKQQERQEKAKRDNMSKKHPNLIQNLIAEIKKGLANAGHFTPEQHEQNLKNLIQDGSIVSYSSSKKIDSSKKITGHDYKIVFPDLDDNNGLIVMQESTTKDKYGTTHIEASLPDLKADSNRSLYLILLYLKSLAHKTGLEKVNIRNLDPKLQAKVAACCKVLGLKTDIKQPENMKLYQKFFDKLENKNGTPRSGAPRNRNGEQTSQSMQDFQQRNLQNMMQHYQQQQQSVK